MSAETAGAPPRVQARIAGALWLVIIVVSGFAEFFVRGRMVVAGDAAATAANILAHEQLYRFGAAAVALYVACDTAVAALLYSVFEPVNRSLSLLAAFFRLAMAAILGANVLNLFAPLVLLKSAPALALAFLRLYEQVFFMALLFFGVHCLLLGYLVYRWTFLPRLVGVLMMVTGLCYLIQSLASILAPALAARLLMLIMPLGLPGELSLTVWLLTGLFGKKTATF
jgi:hypothetical protein